MGQEIWRELDKGQGAQKEMRSKAVHAWPGELSRRESRGPEMSFCAKVKHELFCLSDRACKAAAAAAAAVVVVVVYLA